MHFSFTSEHERETAWRSKSRTIFKKNEDCIALEETAVKDGSPMTRNIALKARFLLRVRAAKLQPTHGPLGDITDVIQQENFQNVSFLCIFSFEKARLHGSRAQFDVF